MYIDSAQKFAKGRAAYENMADLHERIRNCPDDDICVELKHDGRVGRTFTFLIACLIELGNEYDKKITLILPDRMMKHAKNMDILEHYSTDKSILLNFRPIKSAGDAATIAGEIVGKAPVKMRNDAQEALVSKIGEMYNNAFEHSQAKSIMAGIYYKSSVNGRKIFCFSCYDTGIGIIEKIRGHLNADGRDVEGLLKWALMKGNSTSARGELPKGLGLPLLLSFAKANNGTVRICTGQALFEQKKGNQTFSKLKNSFQGTLFEMDIIADQDSTYVLRGKAGD